MPELSKPEWVNRYRVRQFIRAGLFVFSGILAAIGNLYFWWESPEYSVSTRLGGLTGINVAILLGVLKGVKYAYK